MGDFPEHLRIELGITDTFSRIKKSADNSPSPCGESRGEGGSSGNSLSEQSVLRQRRFIIQPRVADSSEATLGHASVIPSTLKRLHQKFGASPFGIKFQKVSKSSKKFQKVSNEVVESTFAQAMMMVGRWGHRSNRWAAQGAAQELPPSPSGYGGQDGGQVTKTV